MWANISKDKDFRQLYIFGRDRVSFGCKEVDFRQIRQKALLTWHCRFVFFYQGGKNFTGEKK